MFPSRVFTHATDMHFDCVSCFFTCLLAMDFRLLLRVGYIYISSSTVDTSLLSVVTSLLKQLISPHETISRPYYVCFCFTLTLCNHILKRTFTRRRIIMNKKIFSLRYCNCIQSISLTLTTCSNYILKLTKFDLCANEMLQLNHAGLNVIN